jgi:type III restriction enzyme
VRCFVKNYQLGFTIPYTFNGKDEQYNPDCLLCVVDESGADDLLNLIMEVSGDARKDKVANQGGSQPVDPGGQ